VARAEVPLVRVLRFLSWTYQPAGARCLPTRLPSTAAAHYATAARLAGWWLLGRRLLALQVEAPQGRLHVQAAHSGYHLLYVLQLVRCQAIGRVRRLGRLH